MRIFAIALSFLYCCCFARRAHSTTKIVPMWTSLSQIGRWRLNGQRGAWNPSKALATLTLAFNRPAVTTWRRPGVRQLSSLVLSSAVAQRRSELASILGASGEDLKNVGGFIDTHCHLDMILPRLSEQNQNDIRKANAKGKEPPEMISANFEDWRAALQGPESSLEGCVTIGCDVETLDRAADFLAYDGVYGAFGIHPLSAGSWSAAIEEKLIGMMIRDKVVAWGECGLDFFDKDNKGEVEDLEIRDRQRQVFARQMDLAVSMNKTLIVHTREAEEETLELMKKHLPKTHKVHVHCFTSSLSLALALLDYFPNLYLGFTGVITFKNAPAVREVVRQVPLDRILLETDGPYMAPAPFRGRVAHPGHVSYVADKVAEVKGVSRHDVLVTCRKNTHFVYGF